MHPEKDIKQHLLEVARNNCFVEEVERLNKSNYELDEELAREIVELNNDGNIQLCEVLESLKIDSANKQNFNYWFTISKITKKCLPYINEKVEDVIQCIEYLHSLNIDECLTSSLFDDFSQFLNNNPKQIARAWEIYLEDPLGRKKFLVSILLEGAKYEFSQYTGFTIQSLSSQHEEIRARAAFVVSEIDYQENHKILDETLELLESQAATSTICLHRRNVFLAAWKIHLTDSTLSDRTLKVISTVLDQADSDFIEHAARQLWLSKLNPSEELIELILNSFLDVPFEKQYIIDLIDHALVRCIADQHEKKVLSFIEDWILRNRQGSAIEKLDSTISEIRKNKSTVEALLTKFLLSRKSVLCMAASRIPLKDEINYVLDIDQLEMGSQRPVKYLIYKVVGWFGLLKPDLAANLLCSLINKAEDEELALIKQFLGDPLLLLCTTDLQEHLKSLSSEHPSYVPIIDEVLCNFESYQKGISINSDYSELLPDLSQRQAFWRYNSGKMNEQFEKVMEGSIIHHIATERKILYGNKSIYHMLPTGERKESEFHHFSQTTEIPRILAIDPIGLELTGHFSRIQELEE